MIEENPQPGRVKVEPNSDYERRFVEAGFTVEIVGGVRVLSKPLSEETMETIRLFTERPPK
jgi:hypothetical protein